MEPYNPLSTNWAEKIAAAVFCLVLGLMITVFIVEANKPSGPGSVRGVEATVLSVNNHVVRGRWYANFLSGTSGELADDKIIIAVRFKIASYVFLEDLSITHALASQWADRTKIELAICPDLGYEYFHVSPANIVSPPLATIWVTPKIIKTVRVWSTESN